MTRWLVTALALVAGCPAAGCVNTPVSNLAAAMPGALERPFTVSVGPLDGLEGEALLQSRVIVLAPHLVRDGTEARHVCAHELGHVLGCEHVPGPAIMFYRHGPGEQLIETPTPLELAQVWAARDRVVAVVADSSVPDTTYDALGWGCTFWNRALGAEVFRLQAR